MSGHVQSKRVQPNHEQRKINVKQIVFTILALVIIFVWVASLIVKP